MFVLGWGEEETHSPREQLYAEQLSHTSASKLIISHPSHHLMATTKSAIAAEGAQQLSFLWTGMWSIKHHRFLMLKQKPKDSAYNDCGN